MFLASNIKATTYYISNAGSDAANGTSTGTSWQTIAKVNATTFAAGDQVLFKKGDSWNEKLTIPSSGTAGNVITFGSYGTGVKPIITGFQNLSLSDQGSNIWSATATNSVKSLNTVLVNGEIRAKGRYPNTTYLQWISTTISSITGSLTGTPNYTGGEIVVRPVTWVIDVCKISSQSGGTLNAQTPFTYVPGVVGGVNGYYIQNIESVLDVQNEWCYDSTTKVLKVYSVGSPTVQISSIDTIINVARKSYITFDGLEITGSNSHAVISDTANHITFQNCSFNNNGGYVVYGVSVNSMTFESDSIQNSLSNGILFYLDTSTIINSCYFKNTGKFSGMGISGDQTYMDIYQSGVTPHITNNRIDSSGYIPIYFKGQNSLIYRNYITNYCLIKDDGGGIYTFQSGYPQNYNQGSIIRSNIIINGVGHIDGGVGAAPLAAGIYLDIFARGIRVDSNFIYGTSYISLLTQAIYDTLYDNTIIDSTNHGFYFTATQINGNIGLSVRRNIFYSQKATGYTFSNINADQTENIDSNFYLRPISEPSQIFFGGPVNLSTWKAATGGDAHAIGTPTGITSISPNIYYNPTLSDSTILLSGSWLDAKGTTYINSVTLRPFTSVILFPTTTAVIRTFPIFKFYRLN
jgi:hypothetical protein